MKVFSYVPLRFSSNNGARSLQSTTFLPWMQFIWTYVCFSEIFRVSTFDCVVVPCTFTVNGIWYVTMSMNQSQILSVVMLILLSSIFSTQKGGCCIADVLAHKRLDHFVFCLGEKKKKKKQPLWHLFSIQQPITAKNTSDDRVRLGGQLDRLFVEKLVREGVMGVGVGREREKKKK